ncbi:hypothetical protein OV450_7929 [Actinobacteria bacterium OV450]|nr:hypothetical protein OV450_7929 [Actinobacteria bacterium OV450]
MVSLVTASGEAHAMRMEAQPAQAEENPHLHLRPRS